MASMELPISTNKNPGVEAGPSFWGWRTLTLCCMLLPFLLFCLVDIGTGGNVVSGSIDYLLTAASIGFGTSATSSVVPAETFLEPGKGQPGNALCNLIGFCGTDQATTTTESNGEGGAAATGAGGGGGGSGGGAPPAAAAAAVRVPRQPALPIEQSAAPPALPPASPAVAAGEEADQHSVGAMSGSPPRQEVTSLEEMQRLEERRAAQRAGSRGSDAHYRFRSPILGETEEEQRAKEAHLERFVQGYREEAAAQAEREAASSTSFLEAAVLDAVSV